MSTSPFTPAPFRSPRWWQRVADPGQVFVGPARIEEQLRLPRPGCALAWAIDVAEFHPVTGCAPPRQGYPLLFPTPADLLLWLRWQWLTALLDEGVEPDEVEDLSGRIDDAEWSTDPWSLVGAVQDLLDREATAFVELRGTEDFDSYLDDLVAAEPRWAKRFERQGGVRDHHGEWRFPRRGWRRLQRAWDSPTFLGFDVDLLEVAE